jgi:hypothetical protein
MHSRSRFGSDSAALATSPARVCAAGLPPVSGPIWGGLIGAALGHKVMAQNAQSCPYYRQYIGKVVNAVDARIVIGANRFPKNPAITALDAAAKKAASSGPFSLDPILSGKWTN